MHRLRSCLFFLAALFAFGPSVCAQEPQRPAPETSTGNTAQALATAKSYLVSSANRYASEAGREILAAGGSATDAAIAVQLVLGLVEPQSSGIGGGAFFLHWDEARKELKTYDGREVAPAATKPDRFQRDGKPIDFETAVTSGLSVGVPGVVRLLETVHATHGNLPWARLFEPAIRLATDGFELSSRLNLLLLWHGAESFSPAARSYFFEASGSPKARGTILKNPEYAATLKLIAEKGAGAFYEGAIPEAVIAATRAAPFAPGDITAEDFKSYTVKERAPLCTTYRDRKVCGMGPPSSGGPAIAQILKLIEPFAEVQGPDNAMSSEAMHVIAEAEKLAYADRNKYLADPDFVAVPSGLLNSEYLDERRRLIDAASAMAKPAAGKPPGLPGAAQGKDGTIESPGTSHISIVDASGNAVSMTTTIENAFGSKLWAAGFLLNNELTDFAFKPVDGESNPVANAPGPGKRPRSSMSPTIVFDRDGKFEMALGSPGGSRIILYVAKTLIALIDWGYDAHAAAEATNFGSEGGPFLIEYGASMLWYWPLLSTYGHNVDGDLLNSGIHIVMRRNGRLEGAADPRREGAALGD